MNHSIRILILLAVFLLPSVATTAQTDTVVIDQIVAVVGGNVIKRSDIENQYLQYMEQGYSSGGDMKCEIFEEMLFQKLLLNQAKIDSIEVSDKEVENELNRRLDVFIQRAGSEEALVEYFDKTILEIKNEFREIIREQLLTQTMQSELTRDVSITPAEVRQFFERIPEDSLPLIGAEVEIMQIVIEPQVTPEDDAEVRRKLKDLRDRVLQGEDFAALAALYSEDEGTAVKGGELGFTGRGQLDEDFAAAAFNLDKGEVSPIIETQFGYHIIQLIERRGEQINIRHILMRPKIRSAQKQAAREKLDSIARVVRLDTLTFSEAAMKFSEDEDSRNSGGRIMNPYTGTARFEIQELDPTMRNQVNRLTVGQISQPFEHRTYTGQTVMKIIFLKVRTQAHVANLRNDYKKIQDLALMEKEQEAINEWIVEKQRETYIRIDDSYKNCNFRFKGWLKQ